MSAPYTSKWRLHPNETTLTEGRFYFVPEDTPFYPGSHLLGSRDWTTHEKQEDAPGEYLGVRDFRKRERPPILPELRIVGSSACISRGGGGGADVAATSDPVGLERFLPAACYRPLLGSACERIQRCPDVALIATIMAWVYLSPTYAASLAETLLGAGAVSETFDDGGDTSVSGSVVCQRNGEAWQWCDGTRNSGQLLSQAYGTAFGPKSYGLYSTTPIYQHYATRLLSRFTAAGAAGCAKFVFVGHSYGGAAAAVAAARLKTLYPDREVALYTLGAPRAGDVRLTNILRSVCQTHIRRPNDPIPWLPPQLRELDGSGFGLILSPFWQGWGRYANYEFRKTITPTGWAIPTDDDQPDNTDMMTIIEKIASQLALGDFIDHALPLYANDMARNCGLPLPFPLA